MPQPAATRRRFRLPLAVALILGSARLIAAETPPPPEAPAPTARVLYLVRHGAYAIDPARDESPGPGLLPLGVAQARLAGARLAALPFRFDAISASPMTRAHETARVIAADLPGARIEIDAELAECTPPTWRTEVTADESAESLAACAATLDRVFARRFVPAAGAERRELIVAHGNVIRYLVTRALRADPKAWLEMSVHHASLTVIRVEPDGRCKVIALGDAGHLPPSLHTGATGDPERDLAVPPG